MALILTPGLDAADSDSFVVGDAPVTLTLVPAAAAGFERNAAVAIVRLLDGGREVAVGSLTTRGDGVSKVLAGGGEYLVRRAAGSGVGVDALGAE